MESDVSSHHSEDEIVLAVDAGDGNLVPLTLDNLPITLGRSQRCRIRLDGMSVSSIHAEIFAADDGNIVFVDDSRVGSFLNGEHFHREQRIIQMWDVIQLGSEANGSLIHIVVYSPPSPRSSFHIDSVSRSFASSSSIGYRKSSEGTEASDFDFAQLESFARDIHLGDAYRDCGKYESNSTPNSEISVSKRSRQAVLCGPPPNISWKEGREARTQRGFQSILDDKELSTVLKRQDQGLVRTSNAMMQQVQNSATKNSRRSLFDVLNRPRVDIFGKPIPPKKASFRVMEEKEVERRVREAREQEQRAAEEAASAAQEAYENRVAQKQKVRAPANSLVGFKEFG